MMEFDARTARFLDEAYQGRDVIRRRHANLDALAPRAGETIADIGAGPGLLTLELSRAVGEDGQVLAVDPSAEMRATAAARCAGRANVAIRDGSAEALPVADGTLDRAISVQVMEYVADLPAALAEARRALRPGGRLVIGDWHWDSQVWHSDDPILMARMLAHWDGHLVHRDVPARLPAALAAAGFAVEGVTPVVFHDHEGRADGLARMMLLLIPPYVVGNGLAPRAEVEAWAAEQERLIAEGRFFFSLTHYVVSARRL